MADTIRLEVPADTGAAARRAHGPGRRRRARRLSLDEIDDLYVAVEELLSAPRSS